MRERKMERKEPSLLFQVCGKEKWNERNRPYCSTVPLFSPGQKIHSYSTLSTYAEMRYSSHPAMMITIPIQFPREVT